MKIRNILYAMFSGVLLLIPSIVAADDPITYTEVSTLCYSDTSNATVKMSKSGKESHLNEVYIFYSDADRDIMDGWIFVHQNTVIKPSGNAVMWGHIDRYPDNMLVDDTYMGKLTEDFYLKLPRDPMAGTFIGEGYLEGVTVSYQGIPVEEPGPCPEEPIQCEEGGGYECEDFFPMAREYSGEITGYPEER